MTDVDKAAIRLIAPCGINCRVCIAFLRDKNKCTGCRGVENKKAKHLLTCKIRNCDYLAMTDSKFCCDCTKFPCIRIKKLNKRYVSRYNLNIIENFRLIKEYGLEYFIQLEKVKWKCNYCGGTICVHRGFCMDCGKSN